MDIAAGHWVGRMERGVFGCYRVDLARYHLASPYIGGERGDKIQILIRDPPTGV